MELYTNSGAKQRNVRQECEFRGKTAECAAGMRIQGQFSGMCGRNFSTANQQHASIMRNYNSSEISSTNTNSGANQPNVLH